MTHLLPPQLLRLFAPRPPPEYLRPLPGDKDPNARPAPRTAKQVEQRKIRPLEGMAAFLERARQEISQHPTDAADETDAIVTQTEVRREERAKERADTRQRMLDTYRPHENTHAAGDPYRTLFVARLSYDTTERELAREFERYGRIEDIHLVRGPDGKSRGYAFLLFDRERDQRSTYSNLPFFGFTSCMDLPVAAYARSEGVRIDGRRILVDVERGRTVPDWKPARLGGGLGGQSRKPKQKVRPDSFRGVVGGRGGFVPASGGGGGRGGGFRGGRGGFRGSGRGGAGGGFRDRGSSFRDRGGDRFSRPRDHSYRDRDGLHDASGSLSYGAPGPARSYEDRAPKRMRY